MNQPYPSASSQRKVKKCSRADAAGRAQARAHERDLTTSTFKFPCSARRHGTRLAPAGASVGFARPRKGRTEAPFLCGFIIAVMRSPTRSAASCRGSAARWAYRAVVCGCVWPRSAPMIGRLEPAAAATDAKLCRKSCRRTSGASAFFRIRSHACDGPTSGRSLWRLRITQPSGLVAEISGQVTVSQATSERSGSSRSSDAPGSPFRRTSIAPCRSCR